MVNVKKLAQWMLIILAWAAHNEFCHCQRPEDENQLRKDLSSNYDNAVRPRWPTEVHLSYQLRSVEDLDIANQLFTQLGFFTFVWQDERLRWNSSEYGNITFMFLEWAWKPTFLVVNGAEHFKRHGSSADASFPMVFSNGTVRWSALLQTTTGCHVNSYYFPYDEQTCEVNVAFWDHYYGIDLELKIDRVMAGLHVYLASGEWEYLSSYLYNLTTWYCCPSSLVGRVEILLSFRRLRAFYIYTLVMPPVLLSFCIVFTFLLPSGCKERLDYSLTILLAYTVFLTTTSDFIPRNARGFPYMARHLIGVLFLCSLALLNVVLNIRMYSKETIPPAVVKKVYKALNYVTHLMCQKCKSKGVPDLEHTVVVDSDMNENVNSSTQDHDPKPATEEPEVNKPEVNEPEAEITWQQIAALADRYCFVLYALIVVVLNIVLFGILAGGSSHHPGAMLGEHVQTV